MQKVVFSVQNFLRRDDGAVTVDWVVLAAALVGLGVSAAAAVRSGTSDLGADIGSALSGASVAMMGDGGAQAGLTWDLLVVSQETYEFWLSATDGDDAETLTAWFNQHLNDLDGYGYSTPEYNLDAMAMYVQSMDAQGYDTTEVRAAFDAAYAEYQAAQG